MPTRKRPLADYAAKRDFTRSPEPRGGRRSAGPPSFCVQKHLASHLHYDFRLEHAGVLLSWAVPKGPSLDPSVKRMAVRVEDHPLDYGTFEGVIPAGYGAGIVLLWDRGTWTPDPLTPDVDAALAKGELKFSLDGVKLKGSWVLVRTKRQTGGPEQWLLIKHRDGWSGDVDVATAAPQSVKTFGDLSDVLAAHGGAPAAWQTAPPVKGGQTGKLLAEVVDKSRRAPAPPPAMRPPSKATNRTKVLYPATGFTKGDLIDYYARVAPLILPHLAGRAVTLKRFPDGVDGKAFFEKRCPAHRPDWLPTLRVLTGRGTPIDYCHLGDAAALAWAANLAAIELHVPLALAVDPDRPTAMVFDLDPGLRATVAECVTVARRLRGMLDGLGLRSGIKTSGGKGLHLLVPLNTAGVTFADTKRFARAVALTLERDDPGRVIASMSRAARAGKVFVDWSQNERDKTTACVFSARARAEPTVSWPLDWAELDDVRPVLATDPFDRKSAERFAAVLRLVQHLPAAAG